jgi:hypothetical protein
MRAGGKWAEKDTGPLAALISAGVTYRSAVILAAAGCLAIFAPLVYLYRKSADTVLLFGIASVTSRLWTYNRNHSDTILVFLLLAQWRLAARTKESRAFAVFLATAISLWIPASVADSRLLQIAAIAVWLTGLVFVLFKYPFDGRLPTTFTTPATVAKSTTTS